MLREVHTRRDEERCLVGLVVPLVPNNTARREQNRYVSSMKYIIAFYTRKRRISVIFLFQFCHYTVSRQIRLRK